MLPNEAVQCFGAITLASAPPTAPAMPLNSNAVEIAATATNVLGVSAATMVNPAMPPRPITTGILQLFTGEKPRLDKWSTSQPDPMLPMTPKANGMPAIQPVFGMLM